MSRTTDGGERRTTCASCGRQVAAGARYCIHCGAEQSLPTPIAAVAAAMARGRPREAANAAHAEPARDVLSDASRADGGPAAPTPTRSATADAANSPPPTPPAYDAGPSRKRLAAGLVASVVAVAIALAGIALWRGEHGGTVAPGDANANATSASAAPAAAPGVAPTESASASAGQGTSAITPSLASAPAAANPTAGSAASATGTPDAAGAPVEIKALPPQRPAGRTAHRSAPERTGSATASAPPVPTVTEAGAAAPAPVAQARSVEPAPAARRVADRWQRLDDELSRCTREDFISRVVCGQRVRFRYCDGYWGKVAQCPGNPLPDHGQ